MSVTPIGNNILVNQMTPAVSSIPNAHNNRVELQNMVAQAEVNQKDEQVLEVRPTEENHQINPDKEHQREELEQEIQQNKKKKSPQKEEQRDSTFKLDIKV
ncbi:hypothetical protein MNB_SM-3-415 [hydrothermal vent metagenome]|uniref:Uncharacterized protein n=1 Tax=hydrothermal vent metagenome TaxID=652676 RepID=A0A1W1D299_9ZZZZ